MNKIYFIEGLPGSGKTTFSKKITEFLQKSGKRVINYEEGDLHPIDLALCSIIDSNDFDKLLKKYLKYQDQILMNTKKYKDKYVTAYTKVRVSDEDICFFDEFSKYEIYKQDDYQFFKNTHLELWSSFYNICNYDTDYVFECIFLQNHINELILKFNLNENEIIDYFIELVGCLNDFEVKLIYLEQSNVDITLTKTIKARRSSPPYRDWIDLVIEYLESTKYGKELDYIGLDGAIRYFKYRQELELKILDKLSIRTEIYEILDNYDEVYKRILSNIFTNKD